MDITVAIFGYATVIAKTKGLSNVDPKLFVTDPDPTLKSCADPVSDQTLNIYSSSRNIILKAFYWHFKTYRYFSKTTGTEIYYLIQYLFKITK
jgi:hypothetical protein